MGVVEESGGRVRTEGCEVVCTLLLLIPGGGVKGRPRVRCFGRTRYRG